MKKRVLPAVFIAMLLCSATLAGVADDLFDNTVVITDGSGHGSGVLFSRDGRTFIWTAAHVADIFMRSDGTFDEATVIQGNKRAVARVLRAGDYKRDTDCALLEIVSGDELRGDAKFFRAFDHVTLGQKIVHCGTPLDIGWNERLVFFGRVSRVARKVDGYPLEAERILDHIDITGGAGCSGGPVVDLKTGGIVGLLTMGSGPSMMVMEPTRNIYRWAVTHDCTWAFDRSISLPENIQPWLGDVYARQCKERNTDPISGWGELERPASEENAKK